MFQGLPEQTINAPVAAGGLPTATEGARAAFLRAQETSLVPLFSQGSQRKDIRESALRIDYVEMLENGRTPEEVASIFGFSADEYKNSGFHDLSRVRDGRVNFNSAIARKLLKPEHATTILSAEEATALGQPYGVFFGGPQLKADVDFVIAINKRVAELDEIISKSDSPIATFGGGLAGGMATAEGVITSLVAPEAFIGKLLPTAWKASSVGVAATTLAAGAKTTAQAARRGVGTATAVGAYRGFMGNLLLEPAVQASHDAVGLKYGIQDTIMNLVAGSILGGVVGGASKKLSLGRLQETLSDLPEDVQIHILRKGIIDNTMGTKISVDELARAHEHFRMPTFVDLDDISRPLAPLKVEDGVYVVNFKDGVDGVDAGRGADASEAYTNLVDNYLHKTLKETGREHEVTALWKRQKGGGSIDESLGYTIKETKDGFGIFDPEGNRLLDENGPISFKTLGEAEKGTVKVKTRDLAVKEARIQLLSNRVREILKTTPSLSQIKGLEARVNALQKDLFAAVQADPTLKPDALKLRLLKEATEDLNNAVAARKKSATAIKQTKADLAAARGTDTNTARTRQDLANELVKVKNPESIYHHKDIDGFYDTENIVVERAHEMEFVSQRNELANDIGLTPAEKKSSPLHIDTKELNDKTTNADLAAKRLVETDDNVETVLRETAYEDDAGKQIAKEINVDTKRMVDAGETPEVARLKARENAAQKLRNRARVENDITIRAQRKAHELITGMLSESIGKRRMSWLLTQVRSTNRRLFGGKRNVHTITDANTKRNTAKLTTMLQDAGLREFLLGDMDFDNALFIQAVHTVDNGRPTEGLHIPSQYLKLAEVLRDYRNFLIDDLRSKGGDIGIIDAYVFRNIDLDKMRAMGKKNFVTRMMNSNVDRLKSAGTEDDAKFRKFLEDYWDGTDQQQIDTKRGKASNGGMHRILHFLDAESEIAFHTDFSGGSLKSSVNMFGLKMARKSALNDVFGPDPRGMMDWMREQVKRQLRKDLKDPNTSTADAARIRKEEIPLSNGDAPLNPDNNIDHQWSYALGDLDAPASGNLHNVMTWGRNLQAMAHLGKLALTMVGDINTRSLESVQLFGEYLSSVKTQLDDFARAVSKESDPETVAIFTQMGMMAESRATQVMERMDTDMDGMGTLTALNEKFYNMTGATWMDHVQREGHMKEMSHNLAIRRHMKFDELNPELRQYMEAYGIDKDSWDLVRKGDENFYKDTSSNDGREFFHTSNLSKTIRNNAEKLMKKREFTTLKAELDKQQALGNTERVTRIQNLMDSLEGKELSTSRPVFRKKSHPKVKKIQQDISKLKARQKNSKTEAGKKKIQKQIDKKIDEEVDLLTEPEMVNEGGIYSDRQVAEFLENETSLWITFFSNRNDIAIPVARGRQKAFMNAGSQKGTGWGEAIRSFWQYRGHPLTFLQEFWGDVLSNDIGFGEHANLTKKLKMAGRHKTGMIGRAVAGSIAIGYVALSAKELISGREPPDPYDPRVIAKAMAAGGAQVLMLDFMTTQENRFGQSPLVSFLGPMAGLADSAVKGVTGAVAVGLGEEDIPNFGAGTISTLQRNTPFINIFYIKPVLDYLILNSVKEATNEGYLKGVQGFHEKAGKKYLIDLADQRFIK